MVNLLVNFDVPQEIMEKLADGSLIRRGGVVRDVVTKEIVKHLDEAAPRLEEASRSVLPALRDGVKHPVVAVGVGLAAAAIAGGSFVVSQRKIATKKRAAELEVAIKVYLEGVQGGTLDQGKVSRLMVAFDAAEKDGRVMLPAAFVSLVLDYSTKLAYANGVELAPGAGSSLRQAPEAQRRILD